MQSEFGTAEITVTEQLQEKHGVEVSPILITNVTDEVIDMERYRECKLKCVKSGIYIER
ncbi:MAG: hypothetical protein IM539_08185 [Pseudanabaena sp. M046S1SP1A06QC]|nr:hypothetical protein [Pseudanabaena sp. M046S1SP1A06QC]